MELKENEYYRCVSLEDRISVIEMIYRDKPEFINEYTYQGRCLSDNFDDYPLLGLETTFLRGTQPEGVVGRGRRHSCNVVELSRNEFINKVIGKVKTYEGYIKHRFI